MDGNLESSAMAERGIPGRIKPIAGDGGGDGGGVEASEGAGGGGGGGGFGEAASMMVDSTSMKWTDEKHSLYLNSLEESFVNQLYDHEFSSNNLFGWTSRTQKDLPSHTENLYSGQYKVVRGGCWGEVKFERPCTGADIRNQTHILSRNPCCIQQFRSAFNDKFADSLSEHLRNYDIASRATNSGRHRRGEETNMNQQPACSAHLCHPYSVDCNIEVSDQNFVDDLEGAKRSRVCKKKRTGTRCSHARDQALCI